MGAVGGLPLLQKETGQMKTLINKNNPQIRMTAPEFETIYDKYHRVKYYYVKDVRLGLLQDNWTLIEEEPVDLEKELQAFLCNYDYEFDDDAPGYDIARHFYELGLNAKKEE